MPSYDETADALYALEPAEFTAARDQAAKAAKAAGDKDLARQLAALRKPTVAAWLVNSLVRDQRETVDGFVDLGAQLRDAQQHMDASELRDLNRQRQQMVAAIAQQARLLGTRAGARVTDEMVREVEATLGAALAEPDTATAVQQGRLTTSLSYSGLGGPAATPPAATHPAKTEPTKARSLSVVKEDAAAAKRAAERAAKLRAAVVAAQDVLDAADLRHGQAERDAQDAAAEAEAAEERVAQLQHDLDEARQAQRDLARKLAARQKAVETAAREAGEAQQSLERAEAAVEEA